MRKGSAEKLGGGEVKMAWKRAACEHREVLSLGNEGFRCFCCRHGQQNINSNTVGITCFSQRRKENLPPKTLECCNVMHLIYIHFFISFLIIYLQSISCRVSWVRVRQGVLQVTSLSQGCIERQTTIRTCTFFRI